MNFSYSKVLIYTLTFLIYGYSGYGLDLLTNLRDAVLSAETVFGDVLKNLVTVAKKFGNLHDMFDAAIEEDCIFKCPGTDVVPRPNRNHFPKANGCGIADFPEIKSEYLPVGQMTKCCDAHDICYDTCNNNKEVCDVEFKRCLYRFCDTHEKTVGNTIVKACKSTAKLLFTGTLTLGCKAYKDAQAEACYCPPPYGKQKYYKKSKYFTGRDDL